jgi:hypothetical protein
MRMATERVRSDEALFLRKFSLLHKLKRQRPAARPVRDMTWGECYSEGNSGRLSLWYDLPVVGHAKMTTGLILE